MPKTRFLRVLWDLSVTFMAQVYAERRGSSLPTDNLQHAPAKPKNLPRENRCGLPSNRRMTSERLRRDSVQFEKELFCLNGQLALNLPAGQHEIFSPRASVLEISSVGVIL